MPKSSHTRLGFYVEVLFKLDELNVPYVIIGGFAATMFGITRVTLDIDMVVDMTETQLQALSSAFPSPPCYADPNQMRNAIDKGCHLTLSMALAARK